LVSSNRENLITNPTVYLSHFLCWANGEEYRDIGLETCICLAREGASLLMAGRDLAKLKKAAAHVKSQVPDVSKVEALQCNIGIEADVQRLFAYLDAWGGADIVFNNAGLYCDADGDAVSVTEAAWDLTQQINVKGTWFACKHAILSFRRNHKTSVSVINNAGIVALVGSAVSQLAYTASKGAIVAMTRELAIVHAREGFRFNSLCPGPVL
jgi:NAD(P)-dependent dehydrogenase (short-subunit alcohol dehydrogenase family)